MSSQGGLIPAMVLSGQVPAMRCDWLIAHTHGDVVIVSFIIDAQSQDEKNVMNQRECFNYSAG